MTRPQTWERYIGYILCEEKRLVGTVEPIETASR